MLVSALNRLAATYLAHGVVDFGKRLNDSVFRGLVRVIDDGHSLGGNVGFNRLDALFKADVVFDFFS